MYECVQIMVHVDLYMYEFVQIIHEMWFLCMHSVQLSCDCTGFQPPFMEESDMHW